MAQLNGRNHMFSYLYLILGAVAFMLVIIRAKTTPFCHDETATFFFLVQNGHYMPYYGHLDTNNHILNSMLTHVCYSLMGSSKFVLRIPSLLFFLVLLIGLFRIQKQLNNPFAKIVLLAAFVFSYNWFTFFSVSRGYGISFASTIMALSFLPEYFSKAKLKYFVYFCFWMQLAMAASLIMMPVFCLMLALIALQQLLNSRFFSAGNILTFLANGALIFYWAKFSSYLQQQNGLTHGAGESYWHVSFKTLIYMVTGSYAEWLQIVLVAVTVILGLWGLIHFLRLRLAINRIFHNIWVFYFILFGTELLAIYIMKKWLHVNYPEDRTALFFYITLLLFVVYFTEANQSRWMSYFSGVVALVLIIQFAFKLNFRKHELYIYDTFPAGFYEKLLIEQQQQQTPITIGGHRCREFIYGFMNYRSDGALNAMDAPELLHMNCDYLIAKQGEKPYYQKYYDEIDSEPDWGFRLLKRKEKITNTFQFAANNQSVKGNQEFFEFFNDTNNRLFPNRNPIRVDFTFKVNKVPVPWQAWLVVQIDSLSGGMHCFKRSALNWIKLNYNNDKEYTYSVVTPPLPKKYARIKAFIWNIKQEEMDVEFKSVKVYQLEAPGINYFAPVYF